jgi:chemotaxis protein histidine kinase CheA
MINNGKNKGKGIGLVMRSRILSSLLVLGCAVPVAAPVLQPLSVYAEETAGTPSETDPAAPAEDQAATTEITVQVVFAGTETFPEKITLNLLANNVVCNTVEVTAETQWAFTFKNLPVTDEAGAPIVYTVDEVEPAGFVKTIDGTTITNTWSEQKAAEDAAAAKKAEEDAAAAKKAEEDAAAAKKAEEDAAAAKKAEEDAAAAKKAAEDAQKTAADAAAAQKAAEDAAAKKAAEDAKKIEAANAAAKKAADEAAAAKKEAEEAKKIAEDAREAAEEAELAAEEARLAAEEAGDDADKLAAAEEKAEKAKKAKKKAEEKAKKAEEAKKKAEEKAKKAEEAQKALTPVQVQSATPAAQKYVYVNVKYVDKGDNSGNVVLADYRDQIAGQTVNGYHYVGFIPAELDPMGNLISIDLVFEKD